MSTADQVTQEERQAYMILSELFLDTEHTPLKLHFLSRSLRGLGIPTATLQHMLRHDLFPILYPNLLSITGEWAGFDEDWLLQKVQDRRSGVGGWMKSIVDGVAWYLIGHIVQSLWDKVKEGLDDGA
jgi:hypothetical protein